MPKPPWSQTAPGFGDTEPASTLPMLLHGEDPAYADTVPQPLVRARAAPPPALAIAPAGVTLYEVMAEMRRDNRVCPQPTRWLEFYRLLEEAAGGAALPSPPLVGSAWAATPALAKRMCFREQVEWAAEHGCLNAAHMFLRRLLDTEWHRMG